MTAPGAQRTARRSAARLLVLAASLPATGCAGLPLLPPAERILFLGDSITYGSSRTPAGPVRDAEGGFPGRLEQRLDARVRILNRGIVGSTTTLWLADPHEPMGILVATGARRIWPDLVLRDGLPVAPSVAAALCALERPDLVIVLLGTNDIAAEATADRPWAADDIVGNLAAIQRQALAVAPRALVSTLLPNRRDPPALRDSVNARLRAAHPDVLPLGERFAAAGWRRLLADSVHPNAEGYELLAAILAEELVGRGLVALGRP